MDLSEIRIWEKISRLVMVLQDYSQDGHKIQQGCGYDLSEDRELKIRMIFFRIRLVRPAPASVDFVNAGNFHENSDFFSDQIVSIWLSYYAQN